VTEASVSVADPVLLRRAGFEANRPLHIRMRSRWPRGAHVSPLLLDYAEVWVDYALDVSVETLCGDGLDNDRDDLWDCADTDCVAAPECHAEEICGDGVDNDGDLAADCADVTCWETPGCELAEFSCHDGEDNDGNGFIDCEHANCAEDPGCEAGLHTCSDGIDNDGDGRTDCSDVSCMCTPPCLEAPVGCCYGAAPAHCFSGALVLPMSCEGEGQTCGWDTDAAAYGCVAVDSLTPPPGGPPPAECQAELLESL
jgi:hypothetical protein